MIILQECLGNGVKEKHVPGRKDGWMVGEDKSRLKDCFQQSKKFQRVSQIKVEKQELNTLFLKSNKAL